MRGFIDRDDVGRALSGRLAIAFTSAALVGLVFSNAIKATLFGPWPVIAAWLAGGLFLLWSATARHLGSDGHDDAQRSNHRHCSDRGAVAWRE